MKESLVAIAESLARFQEAFADEPSCAEYLIKRRWPDGFVCPVCGGIRAWELDSRAYTYQCSDCRRQTSITTGTLMHGSKLPLTRWFWAAHLIAISSDDLSVR